MNKIAAEINTQSNLVGPFYNFQKACNTVDHNILLDKLEKTSHEVEPIYWKEAS